MLISLISFSKFQKKLTFFLIKEIRKVFQENCSVNRGKYSSELSLWDERPKCGNGLLWLDYSENKLQSNKKCIEKLIFYCLY